MGKTSRIRTHTGTTIAARTGRDYASVPCTISAPTVRYFADKVCLSPNYFGDLIKKETGRSPQEYIQDKIIDLSKEMIAGTDKTVSQIAYELGFQYSQHFNRIFKKHVGHTPCEYRRTLA